MGRFDTFFRHLKVVCGFLVTKWGTKILFIQKARLEVPVRVLGPYFQKILDGEIFLKNS